MLNVILDPLYKLLLQTISTVTKQQ